MVTAAIDVVLLVDGFDLGDMEAAELTFDCVG